LKVLITGGAGFIGHNTALFLRDRGVDVRVFDNLKRATDFALRRLRIHGVQLIEGDVLDAEALGRALKGVDVVVHAAAYTSVWESMRRPALYFVNNVAAFQRVRAGAEWRLHGGDNSLHGKCLQGEVPYNSWAW
jgi:UDP-glucose 4-epimerase